MKASTLKKLGQAFRSGLPFPSWGNLPDPAIEPTSPALAGGSFITEPPRQPLYNSGRQQINPVYGN